MAQNQWSEVDRYITDTLVLPDEASALGRDRGLVFLPGGRVLAFSPDRPLTAAELLTCPRRPSRTWQPLPARPARPDLRRPMR